MWPAGWEGSARVGDPLGYHLALVGLPGSGKSMVARQLGELLQRPVVDFDAEIERRQGARVSEIFARHGEEHFRRLEAELTRELVSAPGSILSPGGGWVTRPEVVDLIRPRTRLVWLKVSPRVAIRRMGARVAARPLLMKGDPRDVLAELGAVRERYYSEADATVDTEVLTVQQVAERVAQLASRWDAQVG